MSVVHILTIQEIPLVDSESNTDEWILVDLDFSHELELFSTIIKQLAQRNISFWGCRLPQGYHYKELIPHGAKEVHVIDEKQPFKTYRSSLYSQEELALDDNIKAYYDSNLYNPIVQRASILHDHCLMQVLQRHLSGKKVVGIMGGHAISMASEEYRRVASLARELVRSGFFVITGGGRGAMEAASVGAYFASKSNESFEDAFEIIHRSSPKLPYNQIGELILQKYGPPEKGLPCLGIPTFFFSKEAYNHFVPYHAKLFNMALRENLLIISSNCGVIFTPGSVGTRVEVFETAFNNNLSSPVPMVFFDKQFWTDNQVHSVIHHTSVGTNYHNLVYLEESESVVVQHLLNFAKSQ